MKRVCKKCGSSGPFPKHGNLCKACEAKRKALWYSTHKSTGRPRGRPRTRDIDYKKPWEPTGRGRGRPRKETLENTPIEDFRVQDAPIDGFLAFLMEAETM